MIISPSARCTSHVWKVEKDKYTDDINCIVRLCKEYNRNNRMLSLKINGNNPAYLYIQLINALDKYRLFNIVPIIRLDRLSPQVVSLIKNRAFLSFYFRDIIGGIDLCPDRETGKKSVELMKALAPKQLRAFGSNESLVATQYNGKLLKLSTNRKEWIDTSYPSFAIPTRDGLLRIYLTDLKKTSYGRTLNISVDKLNNTMCKYYTSRFIYTTKSQRQFKSIRSTTLYFLPYGSKTDIISLSEVEEYKRRYSYDDPSKGFGTRLFYYDEAELINHNLYPSGSNTFKILTDISNDEVAVHRTPEVFVKKSIKDCESYVTVMVRAPRVLVVDRERLEQLVSDGTITLYRG